MRGHTSTDLGDFDPLGEKWMKVRRIVRPSSHSHLIGSFSSESPSIVYIRVEDFAGGSRDGYLNSNSTLSTQVS